MAEKETGSTKLFETTRERIENRSAIAAVIGAGYVGLPLATALAESGIRTIALDVDARKIEQLSAGRSYVGDIPSERLAPLVRSGKLTGTTEFRTLAEADAISICVPTPLRKTKDPDMSYIVSAVEAIAAHLHPGLLIILESTTYPGTTDEVVQPLLEATGLKAGIEQIQCLLVVRILRCHERRKNGHEDHHHDHDQRRNGNRALAEIRPEIGEPAPTRFGRQWKSGRTAHDAAFTRMRGSSWP